MDMSFAIQARGLEYLAKNGKNIEKKLYSVPREIDISVAKEKLKAGNIAIDTLSKEQEKYLNA
jgi:adenosylhomocysteinase